MAFRGVALLVCMAVMPTFVALPASAAPACDVSGTWSESFGTTYLRMSAGGSVTGNYTWENGTLAGIMDGAFLNGTWREEPTFAPPRDTGTFSWQFSADCTSFSGTYSYAESPLSSAGSWSGTRVSTDPGLDPIPPPSIPPPACDPSGEWSTNLGDITIVANYDTVPVAVNGVWLGNADEVGEIRGNMSVVTYDGRYLDPQGRVIGLFDVEFDRECKTFAGRLSELADPGVRTWTGTRGTSFAPEPATPTPAAPPAPAPPPASPTGEPDFIDDAVEAEPNEGDPFGIPSPSPALVLAAILAAAALGILRRKR